MSQTLYPIPLPSSYRLRPEQRQLVRECSDVVIPIECGLQDDHNTCPCQSPPSKRKVTEVQEDEEESKTDEDEEEKKQETTYVPQQITIPFFDFEVQRITIQRQNEQIAHLNKMLIERCRRVGKLRDEMRELHSRVEEYSRELQKHQKIQAEWISAYKFYNIQKQLTLNRVDRAIRELRHIRGIQLKLPPSSDESIIV